MPTSRRSARRSSAASWTLWPQTRISPLSMVSSALIQRSAVDLPEPEAPITAITSLAPISKLTPFRTFTAPKLLCTLLRLTTADIEFPFKAAAPGRERVADGEVEGGDDDEHRERLKDRVVDKLAGLGELDEADNRGQRGVLDDLHEEADGRRRGDAHRLRQDHQPHALDAGERQAFGGFPLRLGHRLDAATPDLAQVSRDIHRQRQARRGQRRDAEANPRQAEEGH